MLRRPNLLRALYYITIAAYLPITFLIGKSMLNEGGRMRLFEAVILFVGLFPVAYSVFMLTLVQGHFPDKPISRNQSNMIIIGFCMQIISTVLLGFGAGVYITDIIHRGIQRFGRFDLTDLIFGFSIVLLAPLNLLVSIYALPIRNTIQRKSKEKMLQAFD